jgi:hypothetical protein
VSATNYTDLPQTRADLGHVYLSTACLHARERPELHQYCNATRALHGEEKFPGTCKWCAAPCICQCHHREQLTPGQQHLFERLEELVDQALAQYDQGFAVNVEAEMRNLARELSASQLDT